MVDLKAAREAYNKFIIDYVKLIRRKFNFADAMTKDSVLREFI